MRMNNTFFRPMLGSLVAGAALWLGGCATVTTVESDVQSFTTAATAVQAGPFRFERLLSQNQDEGEAALLEGMAQTALEKRGFVHNPGGARYSVQIGAGTSDAVVVYPDPFFGRPFWYPYSRPSLLRGRLFYTSPWPDREVYVTRVRLEIRDLATGKLVYESTATNEQSWFKASRVLPALFEAAMADFPSPPKGVHKVVVNLPPTP